MAATQDTVEAFERQAREQAQAQAAADYFVALGNQMGNSQLADDFHFMISASARFATVMMVLTQMFIEPMHPHLTLDCELTRKAVAVFDQMVPRTTDKEIRWLHEIVSALFRQAMAATQDTVEAFERQAREQAQAQAAADYFVALGNQMGNSQLADDFHFMSWS
ncbi:hypothetical protein BN1723_001357 [Verticillium longisporum]|uniref:Uncharacterized protein n=1 Tax=Verticillium longisporum TaxID=100787 RepID=A0A0G4NNQ2_VERLO|nr:hypothetical protein BN1723_001357 [Verticillium longisporum]